MFHCHGQFKRYRSNRFRESRPSLPNQAIEKYQYDSEDPPPQVSWEEFKDVYMQMWKAGVKGGTTFRKDGKRFGIMKDEDDAGEEVLLLQPGQEYQEGGACRIDPLTGARDCGD